MKIAYVYDAVYPYIKGGAEKRIYEIGRRLAKSGHEVHWFGVKWWKGRDVILQDGIYLHGVCEVGGLYTKEGERSIKEALSFGRKLLRPLLKEDLDIIDAGNFPYFSCFSSKIASKLKNAPLVITWHEVWSSYWYEYLGFKGAIGEFIEKIAAKLPAHHIAVSEHTKRDLVSLGVEGKKISIVPNGIDFETIQKIPPALNRCDVLFAGRLIKEKNIDSLLRAVAQIKELPISCRIIGEGPEKKNLISLSKILNLEKSVEFLDFIDYNELIAQIKASNLFVLPSAREGFGLALLEAMAAKTPVIAAKFERSAASDMVNGKNGILCSLDELKERIVEVLTDETLRRGLIRGGQEYAKRFDWGSIVDRVYKTYEKVDYEFQ